VARGALAVTGAFVPIASLTLGQGKAAEEYKAQNGNLHLGIFLGMEATNAEMKNTKIIIRICNYLDVFKASKDSKINTRGRQEIAIETIFEES